MAFQALSRKTKSFRFSQGRVLYPAILFLTFIIFRSRLELAAGIWALLAVGAGMAALSGPVLRGPRLPWNPEKTWSEFAVFVVFGTARRVP
jgi:dolichol kinase